MTLHDIVRRTSPPTPWAEADNIPWNEPSFSARMLAEHLSQEHDRASRRSGTIDRHVRWIHEAVLQGRASRVLDLCCGPGLYAHRLVELGHECVGIDYSPASIEHARKHAGEAGGRLRYVLGDVREADFGAGYDLAMMIFGEFNVFRREDAARILMRAHDALNAGGALLLEPQTFDAVREVGESPPEWFTGDGGLFAAAPHVCLKESFWDAVSQTATARYYVIDAGTGGVERLAATYQAYTESDYAALLSECGFEGGDFFASLAGTGDGDQTELSALVARRSA